MAQKPPQPQFPDPQRRGGGAPLLHIQPPRPRRPTRSKTPIILAAGVAAYGLSLYTTYLYTTLKDLPPAPSTPNLQPSNAKVYNALAKEYDTSIWFSELTMGLPLLRRALAKRAHGHVLEASVGTGRNAGYYDFGKCDSVTVVDSSREMLAVAQAAFAAKQQKGSKKKTPLVRCVHMDAAAPLPPPPETAAGGKYDVVVQSMGLCSHEDPIALLRNLGRAVKSREDGGRIILLEHGRSRFWVVNGVLDRLAWGHAKRWGCWWNRDVGELVERSGLRVLEVRRYHFGTTWWIEAVPPDEGG
ncbi:S-adenosyl-L-methionine-dependent methyltransferase [Choiromyces venosus 120613-1]|uniref:S-adenosyl-L-methionine-dependent methyltransferase n=1 Tax=Choiromyces venosus 120613-1 TaxID=1336337 RepID=A0A3N4J378_9PEZI|nr:S-adenosyl-L-methionine-dependent methyltransferase [Choiromyces venosus 120613-1]